MLNPWWLGIARASTESCAWFVAAGESRPRDSFALTLLRVCTRSDMGFRQRHQHPPNHSKRYRSRYVQLPLAVQMVTPLADLALKVKKEGIETVKPALGAMALLFARLLPSQETVQ